MIGVFEGKRPGYVYSRYDNPTVHDVEERLACMEGADFALLFSSGIAAVHAALWGSLESGRRILAARDLYGGTVETMGQLVSRLGVTVEAIELSDVAAYERSLAERPALVFFETPTNPLLRVIDGPAAVARAHAAGARVIVDNTFATPILQNPLEWGADLVIHSATKYLGGHSDVVLGAVVGADRDRGWLERARRTFGGVPDPFAAWLLRRGLGTLAVRVRAQSQSAMKLATHLAEHPKVLRVHYPGLQADPSHDIASRQMRDFGGMLSLEMPGGRDGAVTFLGGLRLFLLATSLGGIESLASHPATSSHRMLPPEERDLLGIHEGLVRLSVGLEEPDDLILDLQSALEAVAQEPR